MFKRIREFLARRRRMREFVAAGREHHALQPFQPEWVDTLPLDLPDRSAAARREKPMSLVAADSSTTE